MNSLYQIVQIEGKGSGCVALKDIKMGTLIQEEIPQFNIKISRFNHSCASNAENVWKTNGKDQGQGCEIRAVSKIKKGDEITLNYHSIDIGLKKREIRQDFLLRNWGFNCNCVLCEKEKVDCETEKKCEEFEKISKEANELCEIRQNSPMKVTHEKLHREIFCYKEMYKFAKDKQASRQFINREILLKGWEVSFTGYKIVDAYVKKIQEKKSKKDGKDFTPKDSMELFQFTKNAREFKEECEKFAKIGEHVTKTVYGNKDLIYLGWKEKQSYFDEQNRAIEQFRLQFG